jgi:DNA-binding MarR family transcriptional regulator
MHDHPSPATGLRASRPDAIRAYGVMNTVRALERLALAPQSTAELADSLQIGVRTARRLLQRLAAEGYVVQDGGHRRRYRATLRLAALGRQLLERAALPRLAAPIVARLAAVTSCTAHLWIAAQGEVLCVVHAHPAAGPSLPRPTLGELVADRDSAAGAVLSPERRRLRSCAYLLDGREAAAAAAVVEGGAVVAAIGVTGDLTLDCLELVVDAAAALNAATAQTGSR